MTGLPHPVDQEAGELIARLVPSIEQVRFANSGTEAVASSLRLARVATGRTDVLTFDGHYHGWSDTVMRAGKANFHLPAPESTAPQPGVPGMIPEALSHTLQIPWNDLPALRAVFEAHGDQLAAVICEPVMANACVVPPAPGQLEELRALCDRWGVWLIFDEVITGFRFCRGGAQEWFGVTPDLTTLAKGLGGGFPVAAIGGSTAVMSMIAEGRYSHSGTYNANAVACAAVSSTMDILKEPGLYENARARGDRLADGLRALAANAGLAVRVDGLGTVFQMWFTEHPIRNWRDAERYANEERFTRWYQEMFLRGVLFHPSQYENLFVSLVHTDADIDQTLTAAEESFKVLAAEAV
jgi:glutamate-1-semialdehyde 2,1-aminomutase